MSYRAGFVALLGEPNAGKSTLLNALLGEKVSIVSDRPQTTRQRIHGILSLKQGQIVFVDAPGVLRSTSGINTFLQDEIESVLRSADVTLVVLEPESSKESVQRLLDRVKGTQTPFVVIVTKGDLLKGDQAPKAIETLIDSKTEFIVLSPLRRLEEARTEVVSRLLPLLPKSEKPLYDEDMLTTEPMRKIAAEYVRESCFKNIRDEVPYSLAVRVAKYEEAAPSNPLTKIFCEIIVERAGHKAIVIGAKGSMIKKIGIEARQALEKLVGGQVYLDLHVDVREGWTANKRLMKELGYVVGKE